ncbi:MAG: EAL domain-containing protein [Pseudomonadota bacterium]|nr:EAL domain-containing protein [Pseudomonadota bacterium]
MSASGDIVVIKIDDASQAAIGRWPWPRSVLSQTVDHLSDAGSRKILLDILYHSSTNETDDREFADSLQRSKRVVLPAHMISGQRQGLKQQTLPLPKFAVHAELGLISLFYNYDSAVWHLLYGYHDGKRIIPSFASIMAEVKGEAGTTFPINYRIDLETVPQFSASDVLAGRIPDSEFRGKTVIVGAASDNIGDLYMIPGRARFGGVFVHVLAAETLKRSEPISSGWLPMLFLVFPLAALCMFQKRVRTQVATLLSALAITLLLPLLTETYQWFIDITPTLFLLCCVSGALMRQRFRLRGTVNLSSGLPNLVALRAGGQQSDRALIVARIINYPQLAAAIAGNDERALVEQIVQRLSVGAQDHVIFQGDEGIFAWLTERGTAIGHHVEALHALFRSPARIDGETYDLNVTFGVEIGSGRTIGQRLNTALVAADEAAREGLKWKYHDPERMKEASWRLSLLSQLDQAIDNGEVWTAFQPQLDLRSGRLRGAEALARWTHPEKGPISPLEFVTAAEQGGRIEKLTMFVLEEAVAAAARFNRDGELFDIAVNLSARMLTMKSLPAEVGAVLARHRLDPARLTLELTETAALAGDGSEMEPLFALRDLGVRLSIDDYGTGLSTLDYLKKIPASEIKIDQSFIKAMCDHRSDLVMVQSTIALAHSLNRTVVAEGVETQELLDLLRSLGCDTAQGFLIGRPTSAKGLLRRLQDERRKHAA